MWYTTSTGTRACYGVFDEEFFRVHLDRAKEGDLQAILILLQPTLESSTGFNPTSTHTVVPPEAQKVAIEKAEDPEFLKAFVSSDRRSEEWFFISTYVPVMLPLMELGAFDFLVDSLATDSRCMRPFANFVQHPATHPFLRPSHIQQLLSKYLNCEDEMLLPMLPEIMSEIIDNLPPKFHTSIFDALLSSEPRYPENVGDLLAINKSLVKLVAVEHVELLFNDLTKQHRAPAAIHTLIGYQKATQTSFTPQQINQLIHGSVQVDCEIFDVVSEELFTVLMKELQQFVPPELTEEHVPTLCWALRNSSIRAVLANPVLNSLVNSTITTDFLGIFKIFANDDSLTASAIFPILQQLITNNKVEMLTAVVHKFRKHEMANELLSNKGVLRAIASSVNDEARYLLRAAPDRNAVCAAVVKAGTDTAEFSKDLQDSVLAYIRIPAISRDKHAPWYIDYTVLKPAMYAQKTHITLPAQPHDMELVVNFYQRCPVPGYDIKSVTLVHSEQLFNLFTARIETLQARKGNIAFVPHWEGDNRLSQEEVTHRKAVITRFESLANHKYHATPDVSFVLGWHGTRKAVLDSLFSTGFANLASTDAGFFGKGLYTSPDAEYAFRVYSSGALLLNWVAAFSPFPVIAQDEADLAEKGNYRNYDAHFVPVYSPNHPNTKSYHACESNQQPQYSELVVFESSQMLPHYVVELQPTFPQEIAPIPEINNASKGPKPAMFSWTVTDVCAWFASLQLSQDYSSLLKDNGINGEVLMSMTQQDWKDVGMKHFGDSRLVSLRVSRYEMN